MRRIMLGAAAVLIGAGSAEAQDVWEFNITPYVWMAGIEGDVAPASGLPTNSVSLSFGDLLENLEYGAFLFASARRNDWVLFFDGSTVKVDSTEKVGSPDVDSVGLSSTTSNMTIAAGRTVARTEVYRVDVYAGARFWWLDNEFTINASEAAGSGKAKISSDASWSDPLVGVAGAYDLNDKWSLYGQADIGGFGAGSELQWSFLAGATYAINDTISLAGAWRALSVDYRKDGTVYDVTQTGPILGLTFRF